jgi:hypothetical protein
MSFVTEIRIIRVVNKNMMCKSSPGKQGILYSTFMPTEKWSYGQMYMNYTYRGQNFEMQDLTHDIHTVINHA